MEPSKSTANGVAADAKQSRPPPAIPRIVPVIPLKMAKAHGQNHSQGSNSFSELATPEQSEASETTSRIRPDSSPSDPTTAPVTPDLSLAQEEKSIKASSDSIVSPKPTVQVSSSKSDPISTLPETSTTEKKMAPSFSLQGPSVGPQNEGHQHSYLSVGMPGSYATGNVIMPNSGIPYQQSEIPTTMSSVISSLERTSLNSPTALIDSFQRNGPNAFYGPPELGMTAAQSMMPPNVNMGFDYSAHPMMQGPPVGWGFPPPMSMLPPGTMGPTSYGPNGNGNGTAISRSHSHSSENQENGTRMPLQGSTTAVFHADAFSLQEHIKTYWLRPEFADLTIQFSGPFSHSQDDHVPGHAVVVRQSPYLDSLISRANMNSQTHRMLTINLNSKFLRASAISTAISHLYGHPLQGYVVPNPSVSSMDGMILALQFAAAGQLLEIPEMMKYGFYHAIPQLALSTIELALDYLQWSAENVKHHRQASLSILTQRSFADSILKFLAEVFPIDFTLNRSAPEFKDASRFPMIKERSRPSVSNPALAQIQFGQIPVDDVSNRAMDEEMGISSILLSLDTISLEKLFQEPTLGSRIGWKHVAKHMRDVVEEREIRRLKAIKAMKLRNEHDWTARQVEATKWKEWICPHQNFPSGFSVFSRRAETD